MVVLLFGGLLQCGNPHFALFLQQSDEFFCIGEAVFTLLLVRFVKLDFCAHVFTVGLHHDYLFFEVCEVLDFGVSLLLGVLEFVGKLFDAALFWQHDL